MTLRSEHSRVALILGATGGIGGAVTRALLGRGWTIRAMVRDAAKAEAAWKSAPAPEFVSGDAMIREDVVRAAVEGGPAGVIVHAANPPGYRDWDRLAPPMLDNAIAAARAAGGARIALPGTVYNFDPAATPVVLEDAPQTGAGRKARVRVALERRLADAAPDVPGLIVRAGDFFGPGARSSWFGQVMVAPGRPVRKITLMAPGVAHGYAYLPDLAETFARLLDAPDALRPHERVHFGGTWDADGRMMADAVRAAVGRDVPARAFPWWALRLAAPFNAFAREAAEVEPYWRHPMRFDNRRLVELLGAEPRTPLDVAMRRTLADMGCLEAA